MQPYALLKRISVIFIGIVFLTHSISCLAKDAGDPVDVRLVIDVSGSMKRNDPNNLRQPAVELLVELLPNNSKAGVWTFGKWVNMLIKHKDVDDAWRSEAGNKAKKINSVGLYTNIGEALEKAAYDMSYADQTNKKHIILLTDGMVDIDKSPDANRKEWRRIVDDVLPKLKQSGYSVHTIALSKNADKDLMNRLSVSTDGVAESAQSADDLMKIFLKAFDAAVPSEQVALTDNTFVIDSSVEEFTALIFRTEGSENTQLVSPDEQVWDQNTKNNELRWHRTEQYDLITVKRPLEGAWGVVGEIDPDSRITVVSNLNLRMRPLPNNVLKGSVLDVSLLLQEDGKTITNAEFLSLMDVKAELFGGNDFDSLVSLWDSAVPPTSASEGRYETTLPELDREGVYQVKVSVDGKTFSRELKHQITLRQAFSADVREQYEDGALSYVLTVNAYQQGIDYNKTQIIASITTPLDQKLVRQMAISELDTWQTVFIPDMEGTYSARVQVKGATLEGEFFDYELDKMAFTFSENGGLVEEKQSFDEPKAQVKQEPEEEPAEDKQESEAELEAVTEEEQIEEQGIPDWILYGALGLGNLLLFALGFFAFKKIMSGPKEDDILNELEESAEQESVSEEPLEDVAEPAEEEEEEPPMEDLDPEVPDPEPEAPPESMSMEEEILETLEPEEDIPNIEPDVSDETEMTMEEAMAMEPSADESSDAEDIDDLDAMALDAAEEQAEDESESAEEDEEDEDMVTAMLKAQGLDLAEDELDDAISSLIDDLDDDEENT